MRLINADRLKQAFIADFYEHYTLHHDSDQVALFNAFMDDLEECPTVDAEPVRYGRWEECFEDWRNQIAGNKCSMCGFEYFGNAMKYCPECGAKMDGGAQ